MPADQVGNVRNDMYLASEAIRFLMKDKEADLTAADVTALNNYKKSLDNATKFIPGWVKIVVAIALGLGTMVGWKRIVVTVGEKIGKTHLTYAQGACAEITAAATIAAADGYGLPVRPRTCCRPALPAPWRPTVPGCKWSTIRNIVLAWVLTLPAAMIAVGHALLSSSRRTEIEKWWHIDQSSGHQRRNTNCAKRPADKHKPRRCGAGVLHLQHFHWSMTFSENRFPLFRIML